MTWNISLLILSCITSVSLWIFPRNEIPIFLALVVLAGAFLQKLIPYQSLFIVSAILVLCFLYTQKFSQLFKFIIFSCILLIIFWCMNDLGIYPRYIPLFQHVQFSPISKIFSGGENIEKTLCAIIISALLIKKARRLNEWKQISQEFIFPLLILVCLLLLPALVTGFVRFNFKIPSQTLWFVADNLLLVSVAEESFFRGFFQKNLVAYLQKKLFSQKIAVIFGIIGVSVVFALFHLTGGILLAILAFIASLGYGYAYQKSGKIESAILVHFGINFIHFIFFTYPAYQPLTILH